MGTLMKKHNTSLWHIIRNNIFSFKYLWSLSKPYFFLSLLYIVILSLFSPVNLVLQSRLFTRLEEKADFREVVFIIIMCVINSLLPWFWNNLWYDCIKPEYEQKLDLKIQSELFEKARRTELSKYDDPEFYNEFVLSMQFCGKYAVAALDNISTMIRWLFVFIAATGILVHINILTAIVIVLGSVFNMIAGALANKENHKFDLEMAKPNRKGDYIDRVYRLSDYAKELRVTHIRENIEREYDENIKEKIGIIKRYGLKNVFYSLIISIETHAVPMIIKGITLYNVFAGNVSLGDFAVIVSANGTLHLSMRNFMRKISELPRQSLEIDKVRAFLEYEPEDRKGTLKAPEFESIELRGVSFGYSIDKQVLHDINLKIDRGDKIAIVGYNGAGKSTFVKLLMHLYQPTSGAVLYNGTDLREIETDSYREKIAAVFQDYRIFAATVAENVLGDEFTEIERECVANALRLATFDGKLTQLSDGIDTILTREFDKNGINLSGGETQKIAIARIFARSCDIVIMDEPSSALDPIAEYKLNKNISEFSADKTVIFISHRLSTTRHVDRIYMFENGRVIEEGSHDELMMLDGKYAEMFRVQAENYISQ